MHFQIFFFRHKCNRVLEDLEMQICCIFNLRFKPYTFWKCKPIALHMLVNYLAEATKLKVRNTWKKKERLKKKNWIFAPHSLPSPPDLLIPSENANLKNSRHFFHANLLHFENVNYLNFLKTNIVHLHIWICLSQKCVQQLLLQKSWHHRHISNICKCCSLR